MIRKIERTSTIAWSPPNMEEPQLALGSVAGALDPSFSSNAKLEIFGLGLTEQSKYLVLLGSSTSNARFNRISWGETLIACGKENGEVDLWNPKQMIGKSTSTPTFRGKNHGGAVRGLHFNPGIKTQFASGATEGDILIWDVNELTKPYAPGARSQQLDDVTCLEWNTEVPHILASGGSNGYTVVWHLKNRKQALHMANPNGRKPVTSISWNPSKSTQMVTCYDDDYSPVILVWDLRNATAPEMTLTGHSKGILSTDWCQKDSDLLISCGKDNRTIVWNVSTGEPIGDLFHSTNWTFDAKWCPRIPDMCAVASYDGIVGVHSILRSSEHPPEDLFSPQPAHAEVTHDPDDPFSQIGMQTQKSFTMQPVFTLPQPPKWLRKPVGAVFGFGAKLITFDTNSTAVSMKKVPICDEILFRADQLDYILSERNPQISAEYCDYVAHSEFIKDPREKEIWKIIKALFSGNMKAEMTDFLGFDPQFANEQKLLAVFSKLGIDLKEKYVDDDVPEEEFQGDQNENSISAEKKAALLSKATPFALYPARTTDDNEIDIAITKCLVVGDFETAVTICLGSNRIADALILAINGGPHLIKRAQDKYFEKNCNLKSYSRLLKAVLAQDISDIVANCKLDNNDHWRDIVGIIATYANPEDIVGYFIQLGNRLSGLAPNPNTKHSQSICFLGAGNFEKVMECWSKNVATPTDIVAKLNNVPLQSLMEKVSVFQDAVQFQDQALRIDREDADIFPLSYMYELYTEYSWLATLNGQVDIAYRFLERIPIDFIPSNSHVDILNLRDQVYNSKGVTLGATGAPPLFPFERIEVVDYNAMVLAEQQQQERIALQQKQAPFHSNATSPNNQAYGYNQPAQNYGTQQYSTSSYQSQPQSGYQAAYQSTTNVYQSSPYQQNAQPPVSSYQNTINPPPTNNFQNSPYPQAAPTFHQAAPTPTWNSTPQPAITPSWNQPAQTLPPPPITQGHTGHGHTVPSTYQPPFVPPTNPYDRRQSQTNFGTSATSLGPSPTHPPPIVEQPTKPQIINPGDKSCYDGLSKHLVHLSETATMAADKHNAEEIKKKFEVLHENFVSSKVPSDVTADLKSICNALEKNDFANAKRLEQELMTKKFKFTGQWIIGIKRLVEGLEKLQKPTPAMASMSPRPQAILNAPPSINPYGANPAADGLRPSGSNQGFNAPPITGSNQGFNAPPLAGPPPMANNMQRAGPPPVSNFTASAPPVSRPGPPPMGFTNAPRPGPPPTAAAPPVNNYQQHPAPPTNQFGALGIQGPPSGGPPPIQAAQRPPTQNFQAPPTNMQRPERMTGQSQQVPPPSMRQSPQQFRPPVEQQYAPNSTFGAPPPTQQPPSSGFSSGPPTQPQRPPNMTATAPMQRPPSFQPGRPPTTGPPPTQMRPPPTSGPYGY